MKTTQPIVIINLLDIAKNDPAKLNALPELNFLLPLAAKIKAKGCVCGLGGEIAQATTVLNAIVQNLNEEQVARFKATLEREELSFGIQSKEGFSVHSY